MRIISDFHDYYDIGMQAACLDHSAPQVYNAFMMIPQEFGW